jgi:hypothetical protein
MYRLTLCVLSSLVLMPSATGNDSSGAAMLHVQGQAWVNGGVVPKTTAVFPGDKVQTSPRTAAYMATSGSKVTITADSFFRYDVNAISLDHGGIDVNTFKATEALIGGVKVKPLSANHTVFQVSASDDSVGIAAEEGQVKVTDDSGSTTLSPGEHKTVARSHHHGGATSAQHGSVLSSLPVVLTGVAAVTVLGAWAVSQDAKPVSAAQP